MELPEVSPFCFWLFPDNINEAQSYKFLDFKEVETKAKKKVPVFLLFGGINLKEGLTQAEAYLSAYCVENYTEIRTKLKDISKDATLWFKLTKSTKNKAKVVMNITT